MSPFTVVSFLSALTLFGQVLAVILISIMLFRVRTKLNAWLSAQGLLLMFLVALTATAGSLFFSDVAGWTPCKLCWYQRIFMYPQVLLLPLALWRKDRTIARYILLLSIVGMMIAGWHYGEQVYAALHPVTVDPNVPCDTSGVSCARTPFFHYGYITIPLMAFTAFLLNTLGSLFLLRKTASRS